MKKRVIERRARTKRTMVRMMKPKADRLWLLAGTALVTSAALLSAQPAQAACSYVDNALICVDTVNTQQNYAFNEDDFEVRIGLTAPDNPGDLVVNSSDYALRVDGSSESVTRNGSIYITADSSIVNEDDFYGDAVEINDVGDTDINNAGYVSAGEDGFYLFEVGDVTIDNSGTISVGEDGVSAGQFDSLGVVNTGTIEGEYGVWAYDGGSVSIVNASAETLYGYYSAVDVDDVAELRVDNAGGVTLGEYESGVYFYDVRGDELLDDGSFAVEIRNGGRYDEDLGTLGGGVIAGGEDGIYGEDVWNGGVMIDNAGKWVSGSDIGSSEEVGENGYLFRDGGLIFGEDSDGIDLRGVDGQVIVYNQNTLSSSALGGDLSEIPYLYLPSDIDAGIVGYDYGIYVDGEDWDSDSSSYSLATDLSGEDTDFVGVMNLNGLIVGANGDGIGIDTIGNDYYDEDDFQNGVGIYNGNGGLVWGGDDGIDLYEIYGDVIIDNAGSTGTMMPSMALDVMGVLTPEALAEGYAGGSIYGEDDGLDISYVMGDVTILNSQGTITGGFSGGVDSSSADGIYVYGVSTYYDYLSDSYEGGNVAVWNADEAMENGGRILGEDSAISIWSRTAIIANGEGGEILGYGYGEDNAVINLSVSSSSAIEDEDDMPAGTIINNGLMSSYNLPTFEFSEQPSVAQAPEWENDTETLLADFASFKSFVTGGGGIEQLAGSEGGYALGDYQEAASSFLIEGEDGSVDVTNTGTMLGRIWLTGSTQGITGQIGNTVVNTGDWYVSDGYYGEDSVYMSSSGQDSLYNVGMIQTAFGYGEDADFTLDDFYNGGSDAGDASGSGILSMVDGQTDNSVDIYGNFHGVSGSDFDDGYRSYLAIDVDFDGEDSDFLWVDYALTGSTGVIVRKTDQDASTDSYLGEKIYFASYDFEEDGNASGAEQPGVEGNTFYVSSMSDSFFTNDGVGYVNDGLLAWTVYDDGGDAYFQAVAGPGILNAPGVLTGAQQIFYDTMGVVGDHAYANQFSRPGGGGADLPDAPMAMGEEAPSGGSQIGLWAKASGTWSERDSEVTQDGTDWDTSSDQQVVSIIGGADFMPNRDGNFRFGVFGGYVNSEKDFDFGDSSVDYDGGTIGAYAAWNNGAFYVDTTLKGDFLQASYEFFGDTVDADVTNVGVLANTGYRFYMGPAFFEPNASFAYVHSEVDDFGMDGTDVEFSNGDSVRAGIGARIGTSFAMGGAVAEISLLGKLWNEFEEANEVTVDDGVDTVTFSDDIDGIFGEVSATAAISSSNGRVSGFVTGGGEFGDDYTAWTAKAGIRTGF